MWLHCEHAACQNRPIPPTLRPPRFPPPPAHPLTHHSHIHATQATTPHLAIHSQCALPPSYSTTDPNTHLIPPTSLPTAPILRKCCIRTKSNCIGIRDVVQLFRSYRLGRVAAATDVIQHSCTVAYRNKDAILSHHIKSARSGSR